MIVWATPAANYRAGLSTFLQSQLHTLKWLQVSLFLSSSFNVYTSLLFLVKGTDYDINL